MQHTTTTDLFTILKRIFQPVVAHIHLDLIGIERYV